MSQKSNISRGKIQVKKKPSPSERKWITTRILDDVFTDEVSLFKPHFDVDYDAYLQRLWDSNDEIHALLQQAESLEDAREGLYQYLEKAERKVFAIDNDLHILEKSTVRECIRVFRSIIGPINEFRTEYSALESLWKLAHGKKEELPSRISVGFLLEFINLFRGITGKSNIYMENDQVKKGIPVRFGSLKLQGEASVHAHLRRQENFAVPVRTKTEDLFISCKLCVGCCLKRPARPMVVRMYHFTPSVRMCGYPGKERFEPQLHGIEFPV